MTVRCLCGCSVSYWRLVYFIEDNNVVVNAQLQQPLDEAALKTAFKVKIAGSRLSYSSLLMVTTMQTVRVSQLFTVVFKQKVTRRDFSTMETSITSAWKQVDSGEQCTSICSSQPHLQFLHVLFSCSHCYQLL